MSNLGLIEQGLIESIVRIMLSPMRNLTFPNQFGTYETVTVGGEMLQIIATMMKTEEFLQLFEQIKSELQTEVHRDEGIKDQVKLILTEKIIEITKKEIHDNYSISSIITRELNSVYNEVISEHFRNDSSLIEQIKSKINLDQFEIKITANVQILPKNEVAK